MIDQHMSTLKSEQLSDGCLEEFLADAARRPAREYQQSVAKQGHR